MARPPKKGLLYFNIDCEQEDNLNFVEAKHGIVGYGVVVKLWKKIYQFQGYFCEWSERNVYLFAREVNVDVGIIQEIIETCFEEKIFSRQLFNEYQILTSSGIQKRWKKIVTDAKRKDIELDVRYCLLSLPAGSFETTLEETVKTPEETIQSKVNENKEDQKIETERGEEPLAPSDQGVEELNKSKKASSGKEFPSGKESRRQGEFHRPSCLEAQNYFIKTTGHLWNQMLARSQADLFFSYYEANGWVQNNSKSIVNWKAAASGWILREMNGNFGVRGRPEMAKSSPLHGTNTPDFKADIEYLYKTFLEGNLKFEHIQTCYFDYLKEEELLQFSEETILNIKNQARERRMRALLGSNQAESIRIYKAYETGATFNDPDLRKDVSMYNKILKCMGVMKLFQQLREQNCSSVFS